jgi:hypothetical protein
MSNNNALKRFFGYVLMAVGGLITVLCGGCTLIWFAGVTWSVLASGIHGSLNISGYVSGFPGLVVITMVVGGLPTAIGIALLVAGRNMAKDER